MHLLLPFLLLGAVAPLFSSASCLSGCPLALASYYISNGSDIGITLTLSFISSRFNTTYDQVLPYNKDTITDQNLILVGNRVNVFFPCDCHSGDYLAANFAYRTRSGDSYDRIASNVYANLTSADWLAAVNIYPSTFLPTGVYINVTINCSCRDSSVSRDYGLFETYPLRALAGVSRDYRLFETYPLRALAGVSRDYRLFETYPLRALAGVSRDYGLFETYPLRAGESLKSVEAKFNLSLELSLL